MIGFKLSTFILKIVFGIYNVRNKNYILKNKHCNTNIGNGNFKNDL